MSGPLVLFLSCVKLVIFALLFWAAFAAFFGTLSDILDKRSQTRNKPSQPCSRNPRKISYFRDPNNQDDKDKTRHVR